MGVNIDSCDDDHVTALQIAAFNGNNSLVTYLLDEGADLEACNQVGMTPFHHACREGKMTVVETLLQRGADIHRTTYMGATALTLAAAGDESDPSLRAMLHTYRPSRLDHHKMNLSASTGTLSKVLTTGRPKKLVTAEEILRMTKNATPLKNVTYDTVLDAVKKMAQQSQSFAVNCFYDSYVGEVKRGDADNESDSYKCEYYDRAQMYTSQCGYQQSKRRVINPRDSIVVHRREGSDGSRKPRTLSFLESPSQNQMRTTPRMLKKSRESMVMDETVTRSGYEQLRK
ncbi:ankyrin repeat protein [Ancylostoma duodenale]|uniref:Ankyrin repeat protein n=1 Tax=Ancylostoma duodenale TaxID=51022 RepID=A0A0C2CER7_9BILA|nr:ankyrin repeat protein [Ancylostoma duodenale]